MPDYTEVKEAINSAINALKRAANAIEDAEIADSDAEAAGLRTARQVPSGSASAETKMTTSPANDGSAVDLDDPSRAGSRAAGATSASQTQPPKDDSGGKSK